MASQAVQVLRRCARGVVVGVNNVYFFISAGDLFPGGKCSVQRYIFGLYQLGLWSTLGLVAVLRRWSCYLRGVFICVCVCFCV